MNSWFALGKSMQRRFFEKYLVRRIIKSDTIAGVSPLRATDTNVCHLFMPPLKSKVLAASA